MSKPFLVIQLRPEDATSDNELEKIKQYGKLGDNEIVRLRAEQSSLPAIGLDKYSAIIVGGSPFDVSLPSEQKSPLQKELEVGFAALLTDILEQDFPFLGCCSGNGLLGAYLGTSISGKYAEPVGAVEIDVTEEGASDPLLEGFPENFRALAGHKEACDQLPKDSVLLATNAQCPVQMFRVGKNVYATQFHPEGDPEGFELRINVYKNHGYFPADSAERLIEAVKHEETPQAHLILERFVARYRSDN
jgi:GMP synthase (glutamine-hydrolysing)